MSTKDAWDVSDNRNHISLYELNFSIRLTSSWKHVIFIVFFKPFRAENAIDPELELKYTNYSFNSSDLEIYCIISHRPSFEYINYWPSREPRRHAHLRHWKYPIQLFYSPTSRYYCLFYRMIFRLSFFALIFLCISADAYAYNFHRKLSRTSPLFEKVS